MCCGSCFIDPGYEDYLLVTVKMVTSGYGQGCLLPHPFTVRFIRPARCDNTLAGLVGLHALRRVNALYLATAGWSSRRYALPACHTGAAGAWKALVQGQHGTLQQG